VYRFQEVHELIHKPQGIQQKMCERNASAMYMSIRKFAVTSVARCRIGRGGRVNNPPLVRATYKAFKRIRKLVLPHQPDLSKEGAGSINP
jgi:hypothetical protein